MEYIQLKKSNVQRFGIKTEDGTDTGEYIEIDMEDIELPFRINDCEKKHRENLQQLKNQMIIIDKKQDHKGKELLSSNEEEKLKALKEFYKKEEEALDLFLGEGGTRKLLNGRKPYYSMYDDINEMLKPLMPVLEKATNSLTENIKAKYKTNNEEGNVL